MISRCRILQVSYPADQIRVKVLLPSQECNFIVKLNIHLKVSQAIDKIVKQHVEPLYGENFFDNGIPPKFALYLPNKYPHPTSSPTRLPSNSSPSLHSNGTSTNLTAQSIVLHPELYLWHYPLSNSVRFLFLNLILILYYSNHSSSNLQIFY